MQDVMTTMNRDPGGWWSLTFAQILAALTMGKRESAFGLTVTFIPGNSFESFSSYFSAGPTVSTNTCRKPGRLRRAGQVRQERAKKKDD